MQISQLCKMIEDAIRSEKYSFDNKQQKYFANYVKVINRSESEDLKNKDIKIEVRIQNLYTINNYVPNIQHLPGVIEADILDSFKMICRRLERVEENQQNNNNPKNITISTKDLHQDIVD
jgi:hypothetical protein